MPAPSLNYGLHTVHSLLVHHPERIIRLCVLKDATNKKIDAIIALALKHAIGIEYVSKQTLEKMSNSLNHQGVIAFSKAATLYAEKELIALLKDKPNPFLLILDGVQDPHNLGACFRSADAAGVDAIIVPKDKSVGITPVVTKVASGAVDTVPFVSVTNLVRTMDALKELGIWIYGADEAAPHTLYETNLKGSLALVLGAEGKGLRQLSKVHCDGLIKIPMQGSVASLNVSVAAGICLFEVVRQRLTSK